MWGKYYTQRSRKLAASPTGGPASLTGTDAAQAGSTGALASPTGTRPVQPPQMLPTASGVAEQHEVIP